MPEKGKPEESKTEKKGNFEDLLPKSPYYSLA
jgi:hypothetical protein